PAIGVYAAIRRERNVWPALAETLGVETGPDMPTSVADYLEENANVWDQIVAKYNLRLRNLRELVGQGDEHADFAFAYGAPEGPRALVSTIKLRQAGFTKTIDTEDSFRDALQSVIDHKLLPPAGKESGCPTAQDSHRRCCHRQRRRAHAELASQGITSLY